MPWCQAISRQDTINHFPFQGLRHETLRGLAYQTQTS